MLRADADVLIDYRESDLAALALVGQHVRRVVVLTPVLDEVHRVTATACVELGIEIVGDREKTRFFARASSSLIDDVRVAVIARRHSRCGRWRLRS